MRSGIEAASRSPGLEAMAAVSSANVPPRGMKIMVISATTPMIPASRRAGAANTNPATASSQKAPARRESASDSERSTIRPQLAQWRRRL